MKVFDEISVSVAANATVDNVFQGRRFERAPFDALVTIYSTGSAAGLQEEFNVAGQSVSPRAPVNTQNRSPVVPDDVRVSEVPVERGALLQLTVQNTTAGPLTYRARMEIEEGDFIPDGME